MPRVNLLGVPIDAITTPQVFEKITQFVNSGQPHQLTTVNNEFIVEAQKNLNFKRVLKQADLSLADSTGVFWACRLLKTPIPEKIPGADLIEQILGLADSKHWSIYLLGGKTNVAKEAATKIQQRFPNLVIAGADMGLDRIAKRSKDEITQLVSKIRVTKPDILLVAFGAPTQELFIADHKKELGVPLMIGVGGTLDFMAGKLPRAPLIMRQIGLEWLWRLVIQPSRFKRIWQALIVFPLLILKSSQKNN